MVAYIVDIQNVGVIIIRQLPITMVRSECHSFMNGHAQEGLQQFWDAECAPRTKLYGETVNHCYPACFIVYDTGLIYERLSCPLSPSFTDNNFMCFPDKI